MTSAAIRVLLVDDSRVDLAVLERLMAPIAGVDVVATATSGAEALRLIEEHLPDVVCTDLMMPEMDGLELTKRIMATHPTPILAVSSIVDDPESAFPLLQAGALDFFPKPSPAPGEEASNRRDLAQKLRVLSKVYVFRHRTRATRSTDDAASLAGGPREALATPGRQIPPYRVALIGASTGGPQAVQLILSRLPADFPIPICIVQHISAGFLAAFTTWLDKTTAPSVRVAEHGARPTAGFVYLAPEGKHLAFGPAGQFELRTTARSEGHRPSISVMFESAAEVFRERCISVLLTGMGRDGGLGMKALSDVGAMTIAQDADSCVVYGMPREAAELGAVKRVLPPRAIADALLEVTR